MNEHDYLETLKKSGLKITITRRFLFGVFRNRRHPLSETQLRSALAKAGLNVNKTTVYRELEVLKKLRLIRDVEFGDGKKRFELNAGHHHHLVCLNCKRIDEVALPADEQSMERKIQKQKRFKIIEHSLEFFGFCHSCDLKTV